MKSEELDIAFFKQLEESQQLKAKLYFRIMRDSITILKQALDEIIELEICESCRCYGFGDIARKALKDCDELLPKN